MYKISNSGQAWIGLDRLQKVDFPESRGAFEVKMDRLFPYCYLLFIFFLFSPFLSLFSP